MLFLETGRRPLRLARSPGQASLLLPARPRPKPRPVVPEVPDPGDLMAVLNWTMYGLMKGTLDVKAAGKIIYSVQQMTLTR